MTDTEHLKLKRYGFKQVYSSCNGSKHNRGVAILISGSVIYEHISVIKDKEGRFILIKGKVNGNYFTLYNVNIPPGSNSYFYQQILNRAVTETQGTLICGGDFNITLNPSLDSSNTRISQPKKLTKKIINITSEVGLIDVWRFHNPSIRDYTHFSSPHSSYSSRMSCCRIGNMDLSDHCPVYMTVTGDRRNNPGPWRLNSSILNKDRIEH